MNDVSVDKVIFNAFQNKISKLVWYQSSLEWHQPDHFYWMLNDIQEAMIDIRVGFERYFHGYGEVMSTKYVCGIWAQFEKLKLYKFKPQRT